LYQWVPKGKGVFGVKEEEWEEYRDRIRYHGGGDENVMSLLIFYFE